LLRAAAGRPAPDPLLLRRRHEENAVVLVLGPRLEEEARLADGDARAGPGRLPEAALPLLADDRVDAGLERVAHGRIAEHDLGDPHPVDRSRAVEHLRTEEVAGGVVGRTAGAVELANELVGVEDGGAAVGEHPGDRALARRESPGQPDAEHR